MKKLFLLSLIFVATACGKIRPKGDIISKDIIIESFSKVDLKGKYRILYIPSDKNFVNVETYPNIADNLEIKVKNNTLSIREKQPTESIDFYMITLYSQQPIHDMVASDSVEVTISGELSTEKFRLNLNGNAKFIGSLHTKNTIVEMLGKSRANFSGKTQKATFKISDTASIIAPYWYTDVMNIHSKHGNYTEINVEDSLIGNIENTAKLNYYGNPVNILKIDKTAEVVHKNLKPIYD